MHSGPTVHPSPGTLRRYVLVVAAVVSSALYVAWRVTPPRGLPGAARPVRRGPPSWGRVTIAAVDPAAAVTVDDTPVPRVAQDPGPAAVGCWRLGPDGADPAHTAERVRCRLPSEDLHRVVARIPGRDPDSWFFAVPMNNGEIVLAP